MSISARIADHDRDLRLWALILGVPGIVAGGTAGVIAGTGVWLYSVGSGAYLGLGLLIWSRRPENRLGPLLTLAGVIAPWSGLATIGGFGNVVSNIDPNGWRSTTGSSLGSLWTGLLVLALIWFPDGRLPSLRWRWLQAAVLAWAAAWGISGFLGDPIDGSPHPFMPDRTAGLFREAYEIGLACFGLFILLATISLGVRYRRADLIGRLQLRWLFFVVGTYVLFWGVLSASTSVEQWGQAGLALDALFLGSIPAAMAIAILRYRLYDIDRIISRTVTYGLVAIVIAAIYATPVILLPAIIGAGNDLIVAGSTLAAAAAFNPVRRRIQAAVDRRFNRARFDGEVVLAELSNRIRRHTDLEGLHNDVWTAVNRTVSPAAASLWIREQT